MPQRTVVTRRTRKTPQPRPPPSGVPLFCCELAMICLLANRPIEHGKTCTSAAARSAH